MLTVIAIIVFIIGIVVADTILDYVFALLYALAAMAITNNIIHMVKYYKKHKKICSSDVSSSALYVLLVIGGIIFQYKFL